MAVHSAIGRITTISVSAFLGLAVAAGGADYVLTRPAREAEIATISRDMTAVPSPALQSSSVPELAPPHSRVEMAQQESAEPAAAQPRVPAEPPVTVAAAWPQVPVEAPVAVAAPQLPVVVTAVEPPVTAAAAQPPVTAAAVELPVTVAAPVPVATPQPPVAVTAVAPPVTIAAARPLVPVEAPVPVASPMPVAAPQPPVAVAAAQPQVPVEDLVAVTAVEPPVTIAAARPLVPVEAPVAVTAAAPPVTVAAARPQVPAEAPVAVAALQPPVAVTAAESPVTVAALQPPVAVTAAESPVTVAVPQAPVTVTAAAPPVTAAERRITLARLVIEPQESVEPRDLAVSVSRSKNMAPIPTRAPRAADIGSHASRIARLFEKAAEIDVKRDASVYLTSRNIPDNDRLLKAYSADTPDNGGIRTKAAEAPGLLGIATQAESYKLRDQSEQNFSLADAMRDAIWRKNTAARLKYIATSQSACADGMVEPAHYLGLGSGC